MVTILLAKLRVGRRATEKRPSKTETVLRYSSLSHSVPQQRSKQERNNTEKGVDGGVRKIRFQAEETEKKSGGGDGGGEAPLILKRGSKKKALSPFLAFILFTFLASAVLAQVVVAAVALLVLLLLPLLLLLLVLLAAAAVLLLLLLLSLKLGLLVSKLDSYHQGCRERCCYC